MLLCLLAVPALAISNGGGGDKDAPAAALFSFDEAALNAEMEDLAALEQYVKDNEGATLESLQAEGNALVAEMQFADATNAAYNPMEPPLGIPSIIWGLCLGIIGLAVVYFVTEDRDETKKALIGCIIASLLWGGGGFFLNR